MNSGVGHALGSARAILTAILLACPLVSACEAPPSTSSAPARDSDAIPTPPLRLEPCPAGPEHRRCGTIAVPLDYGRPRGPTVDIAFAIDRATNPNARRGLIFTNPGGPGASGVAALDRIAETWPSELLATHDVVAFDPRGIGRSGGARCSPELPALRFLDPLPVDTASFESTEAELQAAVHERLRDPDCLRAGLGLAMGTANVARDMDLLRRALAAPHISFVGRSYGAWLGLAYALAYPDRVDRFVLDAPPAPTTDVRAWTLELARAQQDALEDTIATCPAGCELGEGDPIAHIRSLIHRLHEAPRELTTERTELGPDLELPVPELTGMDVVLALTQLPYVDLDARRLRLRQVMRLDHADPAIRSTAEIELAAAAHAAPLGLVRLPSLAVLCADQWPLIEAGEIASDAARLRDEGNLYASFPLFFLGGCPAFSPRWPDPPSLDTGVLTPEIAARIMVVGSTRDRVTPMRAALDTHTMLPSGARLLEVDNDRHGTLFESHNRCAELAAIAHLQGEDDPVALLRCPYEGDYDEPCDILSPGSCRPPFKCGVFGNSTVPRCMAFSPGEASETCTSPEFCGEGLHCSNLDSPDGRSRCEAICGEDEDCAQGERCSVLLPGIVGVCATTCDPFDDHCGEGRRCKRLRAGIDGAAMAHCTAEGWVLPGKPCNGPQSCFEGHTCRGGACVAICDDAHPCATGSCEPAGSGGGGLGHCEG